MIHLLFILTQVDIPQPPTTTVWWQWLIQAVVITLLGVVASAIKKNLEKSPTEKVEEAIAMLELMEKLKDAKKEDE